MNLATPSSVQKLQTALHDKAKGSPGFRFYALYDKVYRKDVLAFAYHCCKANGGAAGVDDQSFEDIEEYGVERWLDELAQELKSRTYRPLPVRRVYIPKPDGGCESLAYPLSGTGRWKRLQFWCSRRFSRPICSRSNTPIGKTAVHWTP
jgi:RNA-directed DNA polymerase